MKKIVTLTFLTFINSSIFSSQDKTDDNNKRKFPQIIEASQEKPLSFEQLPVNTRRYIIEFTEYACINKSDINKKITPEEDFFVNEHNVYTGVASYGTPLQDAVHNCDSEQVRFLLIMGADVNATTVQYPLTPIHEAMLSARHLAHKNKQDLQKERITIIKLLIHHQADTKNLSDKHKKQIEKITSQSRETLYKKLKL
ncbi:hypothetical protein KBC04_05270 [Candidatus Babeliales bacterium]|nr:hypothetical protein [Candidatus Babeliales bacterium]MBP9844156.1 hypothetical protein [Candidatus Babeliales bacterium]